MASLRGISRLCRLSSIFFAASITALLSESCETRWAAFPPADSSSKGFAAITTSPSRLSYILVG
ncbi:hypothetical protein BMEI0120 [Brucella melitensis bv. 1 str. 16M]|uniref:Lipoprotein n=2 Tax=Brucella TaxID=234 RepID=A0A0H3ASM5_BRUO2|nr:hypothetical protein BMEI0120 [Brucella melitensis bv. 1 str. 16M]ABQ61743.1 conserved hypothetical protein [Brucella ovis ATCC 25840]